MAVLTLEELQNIFYTVTLFNSNIQSHHIRHEYQTNSAPAFEPKDDVIFLNITLKDDMYDKNRHITYQDKDPQHTEESIFYTRVLQVDWVCHGAHSFNNADEIRNKILTRDVRGILRQSRIFPVTDIPAPVRIPYAFNNQWWERTDVTAYFYLETLRQGEVSYLQQAKVVIETDTGVIQNVIAP